MKREKPPKREGTEKSGYEIKTMEKDIGELKKKLEITEAPTPPKPSTPKEKPATEKPSRKYGPYNILRKPSFRKVIVPVILVIIILLVGGGVYYWWNYLRISEEGGAGEEGEPKIEKLEPKVPVSLVEVDKTLIIEIDEEEALFEKLKEKASQIREEGTFQRILIKKISPEKDYFLSFQEIAEILYINIPNNISSNLGEEHTLFLYAQAEGNKLGVINKINDSEGLAEYLESWEETMEADLKPIFLGQELDEPATEEFQDNTYKDIDIRYLNLPDPSLTIDYAVVEDYLIITTSREGMYGVIDRIVVEPEEEPITEGIKNCGSVVNTIFLNPQDITDQEKESLRCISDALVICDPSAIEFLEGEVPEDMVLIGENTGGIYEIKEKEGQHCVISEELFGPATYKTCKIPMDFIAASKIAAEKANQLDMLFVGIIPLIFTLEKVTNTQTGEVMEIECE